MVFLNPRFLFIFMIEPIINQLSNLPALAVAIISFLPISELRGAIPTGILIFNMNIWVVFFIAMVGNILIIPFVFFFLDKVHSLLLKWNFYDRTFARFLEKIQHRREKIEKNYEIYGVLALAIFVAIPLPVTGAWTGTLIAWLMKLKRIRSFFAMSLGILISAFIVLALTVGINAIF